MPKRLHSAPSAPVKTTATEPILCVPKLLPREQWVSAARTAAQINPLNQIIAARAVFLVPEFADTPERIAVMATKYWAADCQQLTVGFLDNPPAELRRRILLHMNAWGKAINIRFVASETDPQVRIARVANDGHWSYVGTDILKIPGHKQTMNLDSFTVNTPDSEFRRVVRHETGHTLGCPHEHMRRELVNLISPKKAFAYYKRTQGWDKQTVREQVLKPVEESSLLGTDQTDPESIMCYQIPGEITKNGQPIIGGLNISKSDYAFMAKIYPKPTSVRVKTKPSTNPTKTKPPVNPMKRPDYKQVLKQVEALVGGVFPEGKLQNRLLNLGLREFLEEGTIQRFGFPFRFLGQLDEAILALAYFLHRFKEEGGKLHVYGLNKLSKGEDKTLSYWVSEKAKLYLEIQNMILLLNGFEGRESKIKRIFTFKNISDIAFLNQSAISVISEQRASKINIGFLFTDTFKSPVPIEPISNTLIIHFQPKKVVGGKSDPKPNFYELYEVPGREQMHSLPYQQNCSSRWYLDYKAAVKTSGVSSKEERARAKRLAELFRTFDDKQWEQFGGGDQAKVHKFPHVGRESSRGESQFFNSALVMMYKAYLDSPKLRALPSYQTDSIINRFNNRVVTQDLVRLERAMSTFDGNEWALIRAVDSTSVKNTLKVHESDPTYRHWLRRSLNRVLRKDSDVQLERVYIIEDTTTSVDEEYDSLVRSMQYYLDYFHYEISELTGVANRHKDGYYRDPQPWEAEMWALLKSRVKIYVTTRSVLQNSWSGLPGKEALSKMLDEFSSDSLQSSSSPLQELTTLDYLFTNDMIYAFDNPRADPGELHFNAYLLRKSLEIPVEEKILFNFTNEDILRPLVRQQKLHRMINLIDSIAEYKRAYKSVPGFEKKFEAFERKITPIRRKVRAVPGLRRDAASASLTLDQYLDEHPEILDDYPTALLNVRREAESLLYEYFAPKVDYFFRLLRHMSVEVKFFEDIKTLDVRKVYPFDQIENASGQPPKKPGLKLAKLIQKSIKNSPDDFPLPPSPMPDAQHKPKSHAKQRRQQPVVERQPEPTASNGSIKILLLGANPIGTPFMHLSDELSRIRNNIKFGKEGEKFDVQIDLAVRVSNLHQHLLDFKPVLVHLSGHNDPKAGLLLTDDDGHAKPVTASALGDFFRTLKGNIRCVVINACDSEEFADAIGEHIDCVIGMSAPIKDPAARTFSSVFYQTLTNYETSIKMAFDVARNQLELQRLPGKNIPKLVARRDDPAKIVILSKRSA